MTKMEELAAHRSLPVSRPEAIASGNGSAVERERHPYHRTHYRMPRPAARCAVRLRRFSIRKMPVGAAVEGLEKVRSAMITETDKYYAKLVILATAGDTLAMKMVRKYADEMSEELQEWYSLLSNLAIRVNSADHFRMVELSAKYETAEVMNYVVW